MSCSGLSEDCYIWHGDDLTSGAYEIADLDVDDVRAARELAARHRDLKIGIIDALNAVLADRYDTDEILAAPRCRGGPDIIAVRAFSGPGGWRGA